MEFVAFGVFPGSVPEFNKCTRMNVVRRAIIRSAGIRPLVRPHVLRNPPSRFSSSSTTPDDIHTDKLSSNPYNNDIESQWQKAQWDEDITRDEFVVFLTALRPVQSLAEMQRISKDLGVRPSIKHYTFVINNCLRMGLIDEAFKIYDTMKDAGISPDSKLAASFFRYLAVDQVTAPTIDKGLQIHRDLVDAFSLQASSQNTQEFGGLTPYHYGRLFRLLLMSPDQERHLPIIDSLLEDMESNGLPTDHTYVATTKIILEMRKKRLFADALDVYRQYRPNLDDYGFFEILQEYCRLSFVGALDIPLITQYFSIVNDMRLRRITISHHVYGLIIKHISLMASKIQRGEINGHGGEAKERLISTVRRVHDFLTLDASFTPDNTLWNQLMDAYQRLDCFGDAYRLWEMMYLTGRYDQITVTIMLDACGYTGQYQKAKIILKKLEKARFKLDVRNWNTWVECLCRLRRFNEALDVVFVQMRLHRKEPDSQSIFLLDKFARRNNIPRDFMSRVETDFPQLWNSLPNTIRKS